MKQQLYQTQHTKTKKKNKNNTLSIEDKVEKVWNKVFNKPQLSIEIIDDHEVAPDPNEQ